MRSFSQLIKPEIAPQAVILAACLVILSGVFVLAPPESGANRIALGNVVLPSVCIFERATGLPCPGCGLTRSMTAAVRGDITASLSFHRLGLVTMIYISLQLVFSLVVLGFPRLRERLQGWGRFLNKGLIFLGILFLINWMVTLVRFI